MDAKVLVATGKLEYSVSCVGLLKGKRSHGGIDGYKESFLPKVPSAELKVLQFCLVLRNLESYALISMS
jgi:hypothetical protein